MIADISENSLQDGFVFFDTWLGSAQDDHGKIVTITCRHQHSATAPGVNIP